MTLKPGDVVLVVMPTWQCRAKVLKVKGRSARLLVSGNVDGSGLPFERNFPDAQLYVERAEQGHKTEIIVPWGSSLGKTIPPALPMDLMDEDVLSVQEASALFGVAEKQLRAWLRSGKVDGVQSFGDRWQVHAGSLGRHLADRG